MYETYPALIKLPSSRQSLWRYFPYERLRELLISEELFFTNLPRFSDGREGSLTAKTRQHLFNWYVNHGSEPAKAWSEVDEYEKCHAQFYVSCWHMNDGESYLMWKAYADSGFAIQTTFERMQASFDNFHGIISGGVVEYVDFERDITPLGNVFNHVITKDLPYTDEREFRLIFWQPDPRNEKAVLEPQGSRVRVDLKMLIERVYINPFKSTVPAELYELLQERGIECFPSTISHRT
jgi:hypothetical protein